MYGYNQYGSTQYGDFGYRSQARTATFNDEITITDTDFSTIFINAAQVFDDVMEITESLFKLDIRIFLDDLTITADNISILTGKHLLDIGEITDIIIKNATKIVSETINIVEDILFAKALTSDDEIVLEDEYGRVVGLHPTLSDDITVNDTIMLGRGRGLNDTLTLSEVIGRFLNGLSSAWMRIGKTVSNLWTKQFKP